MKINNIKFEKILPALLVILLIIFDVLNQYLFDNKNYMISIYAFSLAFVIGLIINFIKAIKQKDYLSLIISILMFIFIVFLTSSFKLGGTIAEDAASNYELYEEGCYYLVSHNNYTKVTFEQYQYMKIIEIIGQISIFLSFGLQIFNNYKKEKVLKIKHEE